MNASALLSLEQGRHTVAAVAGYLDTFPPATRLVALALLAELHSPLHGDGIDPAHPLLETVRVSGEALGRHGAMAALYPGRREDENRFAPCMEELRVASFDIQEFADQDDESTLPVPRPRNGDVLFDIVRVKEWGNPREWSMSSLSWLVRTGQWAYWNMSESSRVLLCRIAAASLTHRDLVTVSLTLKLGGQLGFASLLKSNRRELDISIKDVLADVGELPAVSARDRAWASGMHGRFNKALLSLCNHGAIDQVSWPVNYRFDGLNDDSQAPAGWMAAHIQLKPPVLPRPRDGKRPYRALHALKI